MMSLNGNRKGRTISDNFHQLIHQMLSEELCIGFGVDFHCLYEGYPLVLAGITIPHNRGFCVKRSDGDPVAHALVDAILGAFGQGDIADWFNDQDGVENVRSMNYLQELRQRLLAPQGISIISVQAVILAEQPKLKPFFPHMRKEIADNLGIDVQRVSIQGKTFEGQGVIDQQQGIEARTTVVLLLNQGVSHYSGKERNG
jgi:2-C-methyl-D-erythritol 2,4-cyclodiphosphate synthase